MKLFLRVGPLVSVPAVLLATATAAWAASTPPLGTAASFAVLSSTYTNTTGTTTINGDLGDTIPPARAATVNGTVFNPPSPKYTQAGIDQSSALANLNNQVCTYTFPAGPVDLATNTTHPGAVGIYAPGVYCTAASSAASIGSGGITLRGAGTFIFRVDGALTTVANSTVTIANGASACDVFWTPTAATTLGATTGFSGTDIDASGITVGDTVTWTGRALAFGGTVSTTNDTIDSTSCAPSTPPPTPTPTPSTTSTATPAPTPAKATLGHVPGTPVTGGSSGPTPLSFPSLPIGVALVLTGTGVLTAARPHKSGGSGASSPDRIP